MLKVTQVARFNLRAEQLKSLPHTENYNSMSSLIRQVCKKLILLEGKGQGRSERKKYIN